MSPTPIRDPNAPPDPNELRDIPDEQHPAGQNVNRDNPVPQPVGDQDEPPPADKSHPSHQLPPEPKPGDPDYRPGQHAKAKDDDDDDDEDEHGKKKTVKKK